MIEDADSRIELLRGLGIESVVGNAGDPRVMALANLVGARNLVLAIPNAFESGNIVEQARVANPQLEIMVRVHSNAELEHLTKLGADTIIMGERESARGMIDRLKTLSTDPVASGILETEAAAPNGGASPPQETPARQVEML